MKALTAACAALISCAITLTITAAWADLSPTSGYLLIARTAPGTSYGDVTEYLGEPTSTTDGETSVSRWGQDGDDWVLDVEHRDGTVTSSRVTWRSKSPRAARSFFASMTREGREIYGRPATYPTSDRAVWEDRTSAFEIVLEVAAAVPHVSLTARYMGIAPAR